MLTLVTAATATGCGGDDKNANEVAGSNANRPAVLKPVEIIKPTSVVDPAFKSCNPYFPLVPGSQLKYTIKYASPLIADANVVVDAAEEAGQKTFVETTQIVDRSGGLEKLEKTIRKYVCDGERVQLTFENTDNTIAGKHNTVDFNLKGISVVMVETASLNRRGSLWSYSFSQVFHVPDQPSIKPKETVTVNFEAAGAEDITVPAGQFKTVKILRRIRDKEGTEYYARGIGMVKRVGFDGTTWELKEYAGLKPID
jgi:hypothetical protein